MKTNTSQYMLCAGLALCAAGLANANTLVGFQVDMTQQITLGAFTPGVNVVNARGTFNGWGTSALTNNPAGSNTNLYSGTFDNTSDPNGGTLQYKYSIDAGGWENPGSCGGNNRTAGLPATSGASLILPIVYFNDAPPVLPPVTDNITFQVDLTQQIVMGHFIPGVSAISLRGSFNGWGTTTMTNDPTGPNTNLYSTVLAVTDVPLSLQRFKYYIDSNDNWEDPAAINQDCTGNRFVNLLATSGDMVLPQVYFADISPTPPMTNIVTFSVDMSVQAALGRFVTGADTVECRGSFNRWNAGVLVLTNNPAAINSNLYSGTVILILPPTNISYKFWDSDPNAGNNGYEAPASSGGGNRSYQLVNANTSLAVPTVYYADLNSTANYLMQDTLVTFTVSMTNAQSCPGYSPLIVFNSPEH